MATGSLARGLATLERLAGEAHGVPLARIAEDLDLPKSAAHRVLAALIEAQYVQQLETTGNYALTLRIPSLGLRHLAGATVYELATPLLARLAERSGQLVRLGLVDGDQLLWVAKAQGARTGLRYDPDHGAEIPLALSASGLAWLSALPEDRAMRLVAAKESTQRHPLGHNAPRNLIEVMERVREARERGWASVHDSVEEGISAMATTLPAPPPQFANGVVSIAGPTVQLTEELMKELLPDLQRLANELANLTYNYRGVVLSHTPEQAALR